MPNTCGLVCLHKTVYIFVSWPSYVVNAENVIKKIRYSRKDRQFPINTIALDWQLAIHTVALPRGNCQFIRTLDVAGIALPLVGSSQSTVAYQSIPWIDSDTVALGWQPPIHTLHLTHGQLPIHTLDQSSWLNNCRMDMLSVNHVVPKTGTESHKQRKMTIWMGYAK